MLTDIGVSYGRGSHANHISAAITTSAVEHSSTRTATNAQLTCVCLCGRMRCNDTHICESASVCECVCFRSYIRERVLYLFSFYLSQFVGGAFENIYTRTCTRTHTLTHNRIVQQTSSRRAHSHRVHTHSYVFVRPRDEENIRASHVCGRDEPSSSSSSGAAESRKMLCQYIRSASVCVCAVQLERRPRVCGCVCVHEVSM